MKLRVRLDDLKRVLDEETEETVCPIDGPYEVLAELLAKTDEAPKNTLPEKEADENKVPEKYMAYKDTVRTVSYDQQEILHNILDMYSIPEITADITYSCGNFYNTIDGDKFTDPKEEAKREKKRKAYANAKYRVPQPKHKFDIYPQTEMTVKIDKLSPIPMPDSSCKCVVYDPPFIISPNEAPSAKNPKEGSNIIQKRFASFYPVAELLDTYHFHMKELYRMTEDGGYVIVKTQPTVTGGKQLNSPEYLWLVGESLGFDMLDKFVLVANNRVIGKVKSQQHARRFESYFLVFRKSVKKKTKYLSFGTEEKMRGILEGFFEHNYNAKGENYKPK